MRDKFRIGSGIDYPSVGPEHAYLKEIGRTEVGLCNDEEAIDAFYKLSQHEGIIPALGSAHAVAYAMKYAAQHPNESILVNLSGRGDKDIDFVSRFFCPYDVTIPEDPVTGSAHCTLTPYWVKTLGKENLKARQISTRSGNLGVSLKKDRVYITGSAVLYLKGKINI